MIDHAIKTLSAGGEVTFNIPQRIYRVYGRSLGIKGGDGSRSTVGVFDYHGRLYQIEAKALPGANDSAAETLRGAVRNVVGICVARLRQVEVISSSGEVNWLIDGFGRECLPAIDFAHVDLS